MRTLVCEGIGAFIVVEGCPLLLGLEVFSLYESSWAYLAESFLYRNPFFIGILINSTKRGEQHISPYMQSWVASNPVLRSSSYLIPFSLKAVSLLMASALRYALQTPHSAPTRSPFIDTY